VVNIIQHPPFATDGALATYVNYEITLFHLWVVKGSKNLSHLPFSFSFCFAWVGEPEYAPPVLLDATPASLDDHKNIFVL
jgi:hypothetical protein